MTRASAISDGPDAATSGLKSGGNADRHAMDQAEATVVLRPGHCKRCSKCGEVKALEEFRREARNKDGRCSSCKMCARAPEKKYYEENRETVLAKRKRYYEENRETVLAKQKRYREENPERVRARRKRYYKKNRETVLARGKRYCEDNPESVRARQERYRKRSAKRLDDAYVRKVLTHGTLLTFGDIPKDLIEAKRAQLQLLRAVEGGKA